MDTAELFDKLQEVAACETLYSDERTLSVLMRGVKLSFFQVGDPFLFPVTPYTFFGVADLRDIALMKLAGGKHSVYPLGGGFRGAQSRRRKSRLSG